MPFDSSGRFQPAMASLSQNASATGTQQAPQSTGTQPVSQPTGIPTPSAPPPQQQLGMARPVPQQMHQNFAPPPQQQQQYQQPAYQQYQQPRSVTQQVGGGRAGNQSVQNYLTALGQSGQSNNNANMNPYGQQGVASNVGFSGMNQQQPGYGPSYVQPGYTGMMSAGPSQVYGAGHPNAYAGGVNNSQLGYQGNQSFTNQNYSNYNNAYQGWNGQQAAPQLQSQGGVVAGGTGGVAGQGQYAIPEAWRNIGNADQGTPGSMRANSGDAQYTAGTYNRPEDGKQPAPYTPGSFYTDRPPEGTYDPNDGKTTSDVRAKENISDAKGELQDFLDNLGIYSYEYKNKEHGEGRYISPMAQDFEKSKLGAQAVETDATGLKKVNYGRLIGVQSAALALLNHKYNELEQKFNNSVMDRVSKRGKRG